MRRRLAFSSALLLCVAASTGFAQVRRQAPGVPTLKPVPPPVLSSLTLSLDSISGGPGTQLNGKVTLSGAAPTGGLQVALTSDNPVATVPALIAVPPGGTETTFQVTTTVVSAPTAVQITARSGSVSLTDSFKLLLRVVSVTPEPTPPGDGTRAAWRVTLSGPAPAGGITPEANIVSTGGLGPGSHPCFPYPVFTQTHIPAGSTSGVVDIRIDPSMYKVWVWVVSYGYYASPFRQFVPRPPVLASVDVPATLTGGTTGYATVLLSGTTPSQSCAAVAPHDAFYDLEYTFYFSSNSPVVQVPASTRVDPGQSTRPFVITASPVQSQQTATVTVSRRVYNGQLNGQLTAIKQVAITVTP